MQVKTANNFIVEKADLVIFLEKRKSKCDLKQKRTLVVCFILTAVPPPSLRPNKKVGLIIEKLNLHRFPVNTVRSKKLRLIFLLRIIFQAVESVLHGMLVT